MEEVLHDVVGRNTTASSISVLISAAHGLKEKVLFLFSQLAFVSNSFKWVETAQLELSTGLQAVDLKLIPELAAQSQDNENHWLSMTMRLIVNFKIYNGPSV